MGQPTWSIKLIGGLEVRRPSGEKLQFRTRKAAALVALLALHEDVSVPRDELGEALWPGWERSRQQTNLRQAIAHARAGFAPHEGILATRDGCRLALPSWTCDVQEVLQSGKQPEGTLLPDMTEKVFESWRVEVASGVSSSASGPAVAALPTLLNWALSFEPARALELLHAAPELAAAMPLPLFGDTLSKGLRETRQDHPLYAWGQLQLANVLMWQGNTTNALPHAKQAIETARNTGDCMTWMGAIFTAAFLLTLRGRSERAAALIEAGRQIAADRRNQLGERRFGHALGHTHAYQGDLKTSIQVMRRTYTPEPEPGEESEWAFRTIHRCGYLALQGKPQEAWREYEAALTIARRLAHPWLDTQFALAKSYTLIAEGRSNEATPLLDAVSNEARTLGSPLIETHALEGLALATEDPKVRRQFSDKASHLRQENGIPLLPLDELRIADLLSRD